MEVEPSSSTSSAMPQVTATKQKDRHMVSWTPQEDDILRDQVGIHGTDNWTSIASKFNDKTSRQCRRRWFTYLNTECKKGGWSAEEDELLCEAQKVFGNRWTEIAKVVSGRTDNAVKNRFNTLSKKRAKQNLQSDENDNPSFDLADKGVTAHNAFNTTETLELSAKKIRCCTSNYEENHGENGRVYLQHGIEKECTRPLAVTAQNFKNSGILPPKHCNGHLTEGFATDDSKKGCQKILLNKDDPKFMALLGQAELLSSLARKVYIDNSEQSFEDAWKELRDYLVQSGESRLLDNEISEIDFLLDNFKDLIEDFSQLESDPNLRPLDLHVRFHGTPEHITGATCPLNVSHNKTERQGEECSALPAHKVEYVVEDKKYDSTSIGKGVLLPPEEVKETYDTTSALPNPEFSSPRQTVPVFRSFAEMIPSPKFSASEQQFLLGLLGLSPPLSNPNSNTSQNPSCKRALLHNL